MVFESMLSCLQESEMDAIEIALRKRRDVLISEGKTIQAGLVEDAIDSLDRVNVCG